MKNIARKPPWPRDNTRTIPVSAVIAVTGLLILAGCATLHSRPTQDADSGCRVDRWETVSLAAPRFPVERRYLGLGDAGDRFSLATVDADILLLEVFSMYCPHCQHEAPAVNNLFQAISHLPDASPRIRLLGIGAGNSALEVSVFKERYRVPFPMVPDPGYEATRHLGVTQTPTFIAVSPGGDGRLTCLRVHRGHISDPDALLKRLQSAHEAIVRRPGRMDR